MKIWILTKYPKGKNNIRFREEAKKLEWKAEMINPYDIQIIEPRGNKPRILYKKRRVQLPDIVIPRMGSGTNFFGFSVLRQLEKHGVFVLNSANSIGNAKDKFHTMQILGENNLPIPKTMLTRSPINKEVIKKEFDFPVVIKTVSGSQGKGVMLCHTIDQLDDLLGLVQSTYGNDENLIIQSFVSDSEGKDIRVIVVGGRAIGAMLRTNQNKGFKANCSLGGQVENYELNEALIWLAAESAQALGLEYAGVDILFDEDGYKICEVNSSPGLEGFEEATGVNVPLEIFNLIQLRLEGSY